MSADPSPNAIDPDYLTDALIRRGLAGDVRVRTVAVESSRPTILSRIDRLRLTYDGAAANAPATLIRKTGLPASIGEAWESGRREVEFYQQIAPAMSEGLVPRCFDADWDADTRAWHLLLEDLTDTHVMPTAWPLPPTVRQCELILDARARAHAAWWDDPRLGISLGTRHDSASTDRAARYLVELLKRFADLMGDRLPRERLKLYEQFVAAMPRLHARLWSHRNVTIIHGDAHVWNCFMPRDAAHGVRLFDWDGWRISVGAVDLAYMMAIHWYPDRRKCCEASLLDYYHAALLAHGVSGYDRRMLDDDYRFAVLIQMATPVRQAVDKLPPVIWWNNFERIMMAVDDLGCRELLV